MTTDPTEAVDRPTFTVSAAALDVAEQLRAIVAALPADNAHDRHLAARLIDAAELKKLADLRDAGVLTEEEFADRKAILLGHDKPTSEP